MKKYLFLPLLPFLLAASCKDDDNPKVEEEPTYEGCCGISPVTFTVGEGKVYVPNAFTFNSDGINDVFFAFCNDHVSKVEDVSITDASGESLYSIGAFDLSGTLNLFESGGWEGFVANATTRHKGPFNYKMKVTDDTGQSTTVQGTACGIICDSAAVYFKDNPGCFYPSQLDGEGGYDPSLPHYDDDCFGG